MFLTVLSHSLRFCRQQARATLILCLPIILIEALYDVMIPIWLGPYPPSALSIVGTVLFSSLYIPTLILLLDANYHNKPVNLRDIWLKAGSAFPKFMQMLFLMGSLACLIVVPALLVLLITGSDELVWWLVGGPVALLLIWTTGKLAFAPFLLVLCNQSPFNALRQSMATAGNHFWLALMFILTPGLLVFCMVFTAEIINLYPSNSFWDWLIRAGLFYVQLASPILVYHLYVVVAEKTATPAVASD